MDRKQHRKLLKLWEFTPFVQFVVDENEDQNGKYTPILELLKYRKHIDLRMMPKVERVLRIKYQMLLKKKKKIPKEIERLFLKNEILDVTGDDEVCIINLEDSVSVERVEISDDEETEANLSANTSTESCDSHKDPANNKSPETAERDQSGDSQIDPANTKTPQTAKDGNTSATPQPEATVRAFEESATSKSRNVSQSEEASAPLLSTVQPPSQATVNSVGQPANAQSLAEKSSPEDDQPSTSAQARARLAAPSPVQSRHSQKEVDTPKSAEAVDAEPAVESAATENAENGQSDAVDDSILWEDAFEFMYDEAESTESLFSRRERVPAAPQEWETELLAEIHSKTGDDLAKYLKSFVERLVSKTPPRATTPKAPSSTATEKQTTAKTTPIAVSPVRCNGSIGNYQAPTAQPMPAPFGPTMQIRDYQRKDPRVLKKLADLQPCLLDPQTRACVASLMNYYSGVRAQPRSAPVLPGLQAPAVPGQQAPNLPAWQVQRPRTGPSFTPAPLNYREHKKAKELENQRREEAKKREEERKKQMERAREEARRQEEEHQRKEEEQRKQLQKAKEAARHQDGECDDPKEDENEPHKENARDNVTGGTTINRKPEGKLDNQDKSDRQLMRVLRGLETNMNTDHTPIRLDGKRRSSLSARSAIKAQLTARWPADKEKEKSPSANRRKSLDVRTFFTSSPMKVRDSRKSVDARLGALEATPRRSEGATSPKRRRRAKSVNSRGDPTKRRCTTERHSESPKRSCVIGDISASGFKNCVVRLKRVQMPASATTAASASRATTPARSSRASTPASASRGSTAAATTPSSGGTTKAVTPSTHIATSGTTPSTKTAAAATKETAKEPIRWKPPAKSTKVIEPRRNTNHKMTERNTKVCILCRARPRYMTHHFVWQHQSESYVSRLTECELDALTLTSRFVTLVSLDAFNPLLNSYTTDCRFCGEQLESTFHELHYHFAQHTGEFSYQCDECDYPMAYKSEMAPHRQRAKCRGGLKRMYSYPEKLKVIYLHCCGVCNFVQLNEANVYRHLRMQHDKTVDDATLVKRFVLAAINDPNEAEKMTEPEAGTETELDFFDGPSEEAEPINVVNEPVVDEIEAAEVICKEEPDNIVDDFEAFEDICLDSEGTGVVTVKQEVVAPEPCDILDGTVALPPMTSIPSLQIGPSEPQLDESVSKLNGNVARVSSQDAGEGSQDAGKGSQDAGEGGHDAGEGSQDADEGSQDASEANKDAGAQPESISKARKDFRMYSAGDPCYGLFKCMAADCIYSSDEADQFLAHVEEHAQSSNPPENMLECAYCLVSAAAWSPALLAEHIQAVHGNSRYQCSVCSYRSCSFGNVYTHWQGEGPEHKDNPPLIYECRDPLENGDAPELILNRVRECAASNVQPLKCPNCDLKFYGLNSLEAHGKQCPSGKQSLDMKEFHERKFSCVYCEADAASIVELRCHLADQHYDEHPYGCERVTLMRDADEADDVVLNLHFLNLSNDFVKDYIAEAPRQEAAAAATAEESAGCGGVAVKTEAPDVDQKPNAQQLVELNVLMVKPLLMKLTESTGVGPDKLYQCPHADCGGFFSRFQFWSRHMLATHGSIMPACPHCPGEESLELSLGEYEQHFELHRRKLHVCYYCGEACTTEAELRSHLLGTHERKTAAPQIKRFDVTCYLSYSYHVLMYLEDFESDLQVLQELQGVLRRRIEANAEEERGKFVSQWTVPASVKWLETLPMFVPAEISLECRTCNFKSANSESILQHQLEKHPRPPKFTCHHTECKNRWQYNSWHDIIDHLRAHRQYLFVCCHCSFYHHSNSGMIGHIRTEHDSCDVPVLTLNRSSTSVSVSIAVVMAAGKRTLSPKRCFCCGRHVTALVAHLKSAHGLVMQYSCELCNAVFSTLADTELHQLQHHAGALYKLRCNFKLLGHLGVVEYQPLAIEILSRNDVSAINNNNNENDDDDIKMLDDDDIIIEEELKKMAAANGSSKAIALKCIPIGNLKDTSAPAEAQMARQAPQHSTNAPAAASLLMNPPATQQMPVLPDQPPQLHQNGVPAPIVTFRISQPPLPKGPPSAQRIPVLSNRPPPVSTPRAPQSVQQRAHLRQICMGPIEGQIRQPQQQMTFQNGMEHSAREGKAIRAPTTTQFAPGQNTNALVAQEFYPNGQQTNARNPEALPSPTVLQQFEYPTYRQAAPRPNTYNGTASHGNPHNLHIQQQQHPSIRQNPQPTQQHPNSSYNPPTNQLQKHSNNSYNRGAPPTNQLQQPANNSHTSGAPLANQLQQLPNNCHNRPAPPANQLEQRPNNYDNRGVPSANQIQQLPNHSHNPAAPLANPLQQRAIDFYSRGAPSTNHLQQLLNAFAPSTNPPQYPPASYQHAQQLAPEHNRQQSVIRLSTSTQVLLQPTTNGNPPQMQPNQSHQTHRPW